MKHLSKIINSELINQYENQVRIDHALGVKNKEGRAALVTSEDIILSGTSVVGQALALLNKSIEIKWYFNNGDFVLENQTICLLKGNLLEIVKLKNILIYLNHFSGISTLTKCYVNVQKENKIIDSFTSALSIKELEKDSFYLGSGLKKADVIKNCFVITEYHKHIAGSYKAAINRCKKNQTLPLQLEISKPENISMANEMSLKFLLLKNMSLDQIKKTTELNINNLKIEVLAPLDLNFVKELSNLNIDAIRIPDITQASPSTNIELIYQE